MKISLRKDAYVQITCSIVNRQSRGVHIFWDSLRYCERFNFIFVSSFYGSTSLVGLGRFFSSVIYTQSVGVLGQGISPSRGCTQDSTKRINAHIHPSLKRDSNPRSQRWKRAKTLHTLDRAVTVIGPSSYLYTKILRVCAQRW
jgi:hypothetical protein